MLTETHCDLDLSDPIPVPSKQRPILGNKRVKEGSTWVTIWSRFPVWTPFPVPDPCRMVAALFDTPRGPLAVAGVVPPGIPTGEINPPIHHRRTGANIGGCYEIKCRR